MPDIPAALGRKYGPLPGYAWVLVAAGGTYLYVRHRSSGSPATTPAASTGTDTTTGGYPADSYGYSPGGGSYGAGTGTTDAGATVPPDMSGILQGQQAEADQIAGLGAGLGAVTKAEKTQTGILRSIQKSLVGHGGKKGAAGKAKPPHHAAKTATKHPAPARPAPLKNPHRPAPPSTATKAAKAKPNPPKVKR